MALTLSSPGKPGSKTERPSDPDAILAARSTAGPVDGAPGSSRFASLVRLADTAAGIIETPLSRKGAGRRWIVREDGAGLEILRVARGQAESVARLDGTSTGDGAPWRRDLARADAIELRLDPDTVIRQRLSLPAESRSFLQPIIEHRLDRLTPWKSENVVYGFSILDERKGEAVIEVDFAATSRDIARDALERLAALGIVPTAIGSGADPMNAPVMVDLLNGGGNRRQIGRRRALRRACLIALPLALAVFLASLYAVSSAQGDLDAASTQLDAQRRAIQSRTSAGDPRQAALSLIEAKTLDRTSFALIDRLAGVVPDGTFLTDFEILPDSLHIKGRSGNAPALIPLLESQAGLKDVRFEAPVIREADGGDRFDIVATIETAGEPVADGTAQP